MIIIKKVFKIFSLIFIILLIICGCKKKTEEEKNDKVDDELTKLNNNVKVDDMGLFEGSYGAKKIIFKISNSNNEPIYVNTTITMYDNTGTKLYTRDLYNYVASLKYSYGMLLISGEDEPFSKYTLETKIVKEELRDYDALYSGVNVSAINTGKNILVTFTNNSSRSITSVATLVFYNNQSIVDVEEVTSYNLSVMGVDNINVDFPMKDDNNKINYNRIEVMLKEIDLKL